MRLTLITTATRSLAVARNRVRIGPALGVRQQRAANDLHSSGDAA